MRFLIFSICLEIMTLDKIFDLHTSILVYYIQSMFSSQEQVDSESARRKKLAVYVTSKLSNEENIDDKTEDDRKNNKNKETYTLITDLVKFKNSKEMYSLVQPYINLPSKGAQSKL